MTEILIKAYAKINLALDIKGVLENGYHELDMIMHIIELHDDVHVKWIPDDTGKIKIKLSSGRDDLPCDEGNIAYRAAIVMAEDFSGGGTVIIDIEKRIPVAAGLAGGSGNGAAVMHALNILWDMKLSLDDLMERGRKIGSDVPFSMAGQAALNECLSEGFTCARATYDGTVLEPLPSLPGRHVVLSKPDIGVSTKEVYNGIDSVTIPVRPDIERMVEGLLKEDFILITENMVNVLENYTLSRYNCIVDILYTMNSAAPGVKAMMSGSGPTVFCIADDINTAKKLYEKMKLVNKESYLTQLV